MEDACSRKQAGRQGGRQQGAEACEPRSGVQRCAERSLEMGRQWGCWNEALLVPREMNG